MNKTKMILLWVMVAGIAGCVYDVDRSMYDYPVCVSPEYGEFPKRGGQTDVRSMTDGKTLHDQIKTLHDGFAYGLGIVLDC